MVISLAGGVAEWPRGEVFVGGLGWIFGALRVEYE